MRGVSTLLILLNGCVAMGQDKPLSPAELAKKPPYERLLQGEDAKKAKEFLESYDKARNAEDWDEAKKYVRELIEFRTQTVLL